MKLVFSLMVGFPGFLMAQTVDSIVALQENRMYNNYSYTKNPSVINTGQIPQYGYAYLTGSTESGLYKRPMDARKINAFIAGTGGYKKIKDWGFRGGFSYKKQYDYELPWSSVYNAYNDNPFIWADSNKGKWIRDEVYASVQVATPVIKRKFYSGLSIDYNIGSGARMNEPKPFYRIRNITLQPGVSWQMNTSSSLGISGNFGFLQEENEIGLYSNEDVLLYRMRGYGTFTRTPMVTGTRKRTGSISGATIHYEKKESKYQWLLTGHMGYQSEEVYEGIAVPSVTGYFTAYYFEGNAMMHRGDAVKGMSLLLTAKQKTGFADDYLFKAESALHEHIYAHLQWSQWFTTANNQLWQWKLQPSFRQMSFTDQATRTHYYATHVGGTLSIQWRKKVSQQLSLFVSPKVSYMSVADSDWTNNQVNSIIKGLVQPHYNYISTDYLNTGGMIGVEFRAKGGLCHMLGFNANYYHAILSDEKTNRKINQLQYSILF